MFAVISRGQPNSSQPGTSSYSPQSASSMCVTIISITMTNMFVIVICSIDERVRVASVKVKEHPDYLQQRKRIGVFTQCAHSSNSRRINISAPLSLFQHQVSKLNEVELVCEMDSVVIFKESSNHLFKISPLLGYRCIFIYSQKWGKGWKFQKLSRQGGGKVKVEYCIYVKILALQKDICSLKLDIANPYSSKDICCQSWLIENCILCVCATELCQQLGSVSTLVWIDFKMERYVQSLRDLFDFSPL